MALISVSERAVPLAAVRAGLFSKQSWEFEDGTVVHVKARQVPPVGSVLVSLTDQGRLFACRWIGPGGTTDQKVVLCDAADVTLTRS